MGEQIERLTIEGVEVGERVRRIGGKLVGTVTKKYMYKIAINYDGQIAEGYPAEYVRVVEEPQADETAARVVLCAECGAHSGEYFEPVTCALCGREFCPDCQQPGYHTCPEPATEDEADRIAALVADIAASGEVEADLFGEIQRQEEQQHWEGPIVAAQIADIEARLADVDTLIACESGSCRTHAIESRYYLNERLQALKWAIESRDLPALTQIVAAGNAERRGVAA